MKILIKLLYVIAIFFGFQSVSQAQNVEFTTHFGLGWGITNSAGPAEFGIGLRFRVAENLAIGAEVGFVGLSSKVGGINVAFNAAYALENFRFYVGPEIIIGGGFGIYAGIDWYFTQFFGIYAKTHAIFGANGLASSIFVGVLLPPEVFGWILNLFIR
jgi:hypothetical protein